MKVFLLRKTLFLAYFSPIEKSSLKCCILSDHVNELHHYFKKVTKIFKRAVAIRNGDNDQLRYL